MATHALSTREASRVQVIRNAAGDTIVTVRSRTRWLPMLLWLLVVFGAIPIAVILKLPFVDALGLAAVVGSVLHFSRARRLRFRFTRDRLDVRALTEHSIALADLVRVDTCTLLGQGEGQACVALHTTRGLVVLPARGLAADDVEAAVVVLTNEWRGRAEQGSGRAD